ncbi:hypothetical protein HMI55_002690 [Coelomomyces lativittatus]|nr:hypothetical protein HMI55_002690 [Coelomomyces lativittatus]
MLGAIVSNKVLPTSSLNYDLIFQFPNPIPTEYIHTNPHRPSFSFPPWYKPPSISKERCKGMIFFAPTQHLDQNTPFSCFFQLGFGAASTPFVTGTPFALYQQGHRSVDKSLVGIMFETPSTFQWSITVSHTLSPWGERKHLKACQGNVIAEIDGSILPMNEFLNLLSKNFTVSPKNVFIALYHDNDSKPFYITSLAAGSVSRGTLLLNSEINITPNMQMQWLIQRGVEKSSISRLRLNGTFVDSPSGFSIGCKTTGQLLAFHDVPVTVDINCAIDDNPIRISKELLNY